MGSRVAENRHKEKLEEILEKSGLVCQRPYVETEESSEESEEWLDIVESEKPSSTKPTDELTEEEETATTVRGEAFSPAESTTVTPEEDQGPGIPIFPTPSLAMYRPPRLKKIYAQNAIHVLPDEFNSEIDASKIPRIGKHHQQYIAALAKLVGCTQYESSLTEYWFLDTLSNLLSRAQADHLPKTTQAILIHWFCEWMQEMRHFDMADRKRMMRRFRENMVLAAKFIAEEERLPTPQDIGVGHKEEWAPVSNPRVRNPSSTVKSTASGGRPNVKFDTTSFDCCMRDLALIVHYIYDLFSTDYQYNLVRSIFTFRPQNRLIDASFQLRLPKKGYAPLKPLKPAKTPRKATPEAKPVKKGTAALLAAVKKVEDTPEFLHLMEIKAAEEKELEIKMERDREEWNKRSSILPLVMALDENFLDKYWPPPSPDAEEELHTDISTTKKNHKKKK